jgi:BirA family biotin operon repressor/biotin-[acetyl-CoA-carboxylase] ligase
MMMHNLHHFKTLDSTNDYAKEHYAKLPSGSVILADTQTRGRGRFNREWHSGKGGLWFSIVFHHRHPAKSFLLTFAAAASVARAIKELGLAASVKWPNDVYIGGKKVCGILTENVVSGRETVSIIGIGINVNNRVALASATTLRSVLGKRLDKAAIISSVLDKFRDYSEEFKSQRARRIICDWESCWHQRLKNVRLFTVSGVVSGRAVGISPSGALVIKTDSGKQREVLEGDLSRIY